ncbi:MAG: membrane protein insertion efficiency factor YidD [Helicobacter sp.]|nr:membrane protein insertion efficiency factor YidD [Helicobacter sp.]
MKLIIFYQRYVSLIIGALFGSASKCRFYPTCSEYAKWTLAHSDGVLAYFWAFILITYRILRCNGFFKGGLDYPIIFAPNVYKHQNICFKAHSKITYAYFLVPKSKNFFYITKAIYER